MNSKVDPRQRSIVEEEIAKHMDRVASRRRECAVASAEFGDDAGAYRDVKLAELAEGLARVVRSSAYRKEEDQG